eukprot:m.229344 g.229344  ORF g.229344 m.229344 type:complete len:1278 (+) comp22398_c1_seq4:1683-5516(+)
MWSLAHRRAAGALLRLPIAMHTTPGASNVITRALWAPVPRQLMWRTDWTSPLANSLQVRMYSVQAVRQEDPADPEEKQKKPPAKEADQPSSKHEKTKEEIEKERGMEEKMGKPISKMERTIRTLLAKKMEEQSHLDRAMFGATNATQLPASAPLYRRMLTLQFYKDTWTSIKHEAKHYATGFKLLWTDIRISSGLLFRIVKGHALTRRERKQLVRTVSDLVRIVPFSVFIIVPFMELTLPFFIKFFPGMLPSTFQEAKTKEDKLKAELKVKLEMAKFLQDTVESMPAQTKENKSVASGVDSLKSFFQNARSGGRVNTKDIVKFSQLFKNELTLDNLSFQQLSALCKVLGLQPIGTSNFLRFQLRAKLRQLRADDLMIQQEGIDSLSTVELQAACRERGMRAYGISRSTLRERLSQWLDLHLNEGIPSSLLLMSRVLYLPDNIPEEEKLKIAIENLPDELKDEVRVEYQEATGASVDFQDRIKLILKEQERIKQEQAEDERAAKARAEQERKDQDDLKKKQEEEEAEATKKSKEKEEMLDTAKVLTDKAKTLEQEVEPPAVHPLTSGAAAAATAAGVPTDSANVIATETAAERLMTLEELVDLAMAVVVKSDTHAAKKRLESIKEDISEHKEDIQELEALAGGSITAPLGSVRLSKRVEKMIQSLEPKLAEVENASRDRLLTELDLDKDGFVSVEELTAVMRKLKNPPSEAKIAAIAKVLDEDGDGILSLDVITKVLLLVTNEGADIKPSDMKLLVSLVEKEKEVKTKMSEEDKAKETSKKQDARTGSVYVRTWGCSHNNSDSEYMAGMLADYGFTITDSAEAADVVLLNSCTVKTPSEDNFNNAIRTAQAQGQHVVVAGCVPQAQPGAKMVQGLSVIGVQQIDRVVEVVQQTMLGRTVRLLGPKKVDGRRAGGAALSLPKIRKNPLIEIIAVNTGCLNACTYCKTKHARGNLASYPPHEIVDRIRTSLAEGVVEIWLTSEDTGAYGRDIGVTLPELLWQIVAVLPDGVMLRVGMTNPPYIMEHLEEISKVLQHPRVYAFLHVPVQAGSDAVLGAMKREYSCEDFCLVVDTLRRNVENVTIATDIICAFPGETDEDFQQTLALVQKYKFPSLFINQFYARPGTPAAAMPKVPATVAKDRTRLLSSLFRSYFPYENRVGMQYRVLVTEVATDGQHYVGHNKSYEQILLPKREDILGKMVTARITRTGKFYMEGEVVEESLRNVPLIPNPAAKGEVTLSGGVSKRPPAAQAGFRLTLTHVLVAVVALLLLDAGRWLAKLL